MTRFTKHQLVILHARVTVFMKIQEILHRQTLTGIGWGLWSLKALSQVTAWLAAHFAEWKELDCAEGSSGIQFPQKLRIKSRAETCHCTFSDFNVLTLNPLQNHPCCLQNDFYWWLLHFFTSVIMFTTKIHTVNTVLPSEILERGPHSHPSKLSPQCLHCLYSTAEESIKTGPRLHLSRFSPQ